MSLRVQAISCTLGIALAGSLAVVDSKADPGDPQPGECHDDVRCLPPNMCDTPVNNCCISKQRICTGTDGLVHFDHFNNGCLAWFNHGVYFSPDCKNISGGGRTQKSWPGDYKYVQAYVIFKGCVITAFSGGGIYKSCDGLNIGGGGNTVKLYDFPNKVQSMTVTADGRLRTVFSHPGECYLDPSGDHPAGGPGVTRC